MRVSAYSINRQPLSPESGLSGVASFSGTRPRTSFRFGGRAPLVYASNYDLILDLTSLQSRLPFDFTKRRRAFEFVAQTLGITVNDCLAPAQVTYEDLTRVHTPEYLRSLSDPEVVAAAMEIPELAQRSSEFLSARLVAPLLNATGGTIAACEAALEHGWAFNFSGGFHHARAASAEGFCFFADTAIALKRLWVRNPRLHALIVDLDAHGMNGPWELLGHDPRVTLFDIYNRDLYPVRGQMALPYPPAPVGQQAKSPERFREFLFPVTSGVRDKEYLRILWTHLPRALDQLPKPAIVIAHLGQDPLAGDRLGRMSLSQRALLRRDAFVFQQALKRALPVVTLLSGGYSTDAATLIANSLLNILHLYTDSPLSVSSLG